MRREADVAVVTPYFGEEPEVLMRSLRSVARQTVPVRHIVVADGHPQPWVDGEGVDHIVLDRRWNDYGNTPRSIGSQIAMEAGYSIVCYLDADNWYADDHVETMLGVISEEVDFVVARRRLVRPDGSVLPASNVDDGVSFVDTNCMFLFGPALRYCPLWQTMPSKLASIGDRVLTGTMRNHGLRSASAEKATVYYTCLLEHVYSGIGEQWPANAKPDVDYHGLVEWWSRIGPEARREYERLAGFRLTF